MAQEKKSLLGWLTGNNIADEDYSFDDLESGSNHGKKLPIISKKGTPTYETFEEAKEEVGELHVDVYQTPTHIIIKTMIAGVRPEDLDVSVTRDMVTIRGKRERHTESNSTDYFFQELYWGAFSRTIMLEQEIEIEGAEATEKHGLLIIRLPKINKGRQAKLKVKSS